MSTETPAVKGPVPLKAITLGVVVFISIALMVASSRIGPPYPAIAQLALYATCVALVLGRLRACFRLAKAPAQASRLKSVAGFFGLTVFMVVLNLPSAFRSDDETRSRAIANLLPLWALWAALDLVVSLLQKPLPSSRLDEDTMVATDS